MMQTLCATEWQHPLQKRKVIMTPGCEITPFVFKGRFYRIENFKRAEDFPGKPLDSMFHEDGFRIRDVEKDLVITIPLLNHYFATASVWRERVYVFCGDYEWNRPWWNIRKINMIHSDDLISWSKPVTIITAEGNENLFNNSVCHDGQRFVMLVETDDQRWPKFTFKFYESRDLVNWQLIDNALYGTTKYVGGPALYFEDGYYYCTYTSCSGTDSRGYNCYETRITRSTNLVDWSDAPENRPFVTFNPMHRTSPIHQPDVYEINASDVEICEYDGKTLVYFNGGDQMTCGDLQLAEFDGSKSELFQLFFDE